MLGLCKALDLRLVAPHAKARLWQLWVEAFSKDLRATQDSVGTLKSDVVKLKGNVATLRSDVLDMKAFDLIEKSNGENYVIEEARKLRTHHVARDIPKTSIHNLHLRGQKQIPQSVKVWTSIMMKITSWEIQSSKKRWNSMLFLGQKMFTLSLLFLIRLM